MKCYTLVLAAALCVLLAGCSSGAKTSYTAEEYIPIFVEAYNEACAETGSGPLDAGAEEIVLGCGHPVMFMDENSQYTWIIGELAASTDQNLLIMQDYTTAIIATDPSLSEDDAWEICEKLMTDSLESFEKSAIKQGDEITVKKNKHAYRMSISGNDWVTRFSFKLDW